MVKQNVKLTDKWSQVSCEAIIYIHERQKNIIRCMVKSELCRQTVPDVSSESHEVHDNMKTNQYSSERWTEHLGNNINEYRKSPNK